MTEETKKAIPVTEMIAGLVMWLSLGGLVISAGFLANFFIYASKISLNSSFALMAISVPVFFITRWISRTPWVLVGFVSLGLLTIGFLFGPIVRFLMTFETGSYLLLLIPGIVFAIPLGLIARNLWVK